MRQPGQVASALLLGSVCPLCGNARPLHQPLCFDCATDNAAVAEAAARGLLGLPLPRAAPCFVCGTTGPERRTRRFVVLGTWVRQATCQRCFEVPTNEPKEGTWDDSE